MPAFDKDLAALDALRDLPPAETEAPLRKLLQNRNNFLVAKAAKVAAAHNHQTLANDLAQAFNRFLENPAKTDPQCWAKLEIVEALAVFESQEPEPFLAALRHIQLEPVWGGASDSAGPLRAKAALALVQCRTLSDTALLTYLIPLFADPELPVQIAAARALTRVATDTASLLLRLRAELGSGQPELLGSCYAGVLAIEGPSAIPWAAKFLRPQTPDDLSAEAAFAIAETRTEIAFNLLHATWSATPDRRFRDTLLSPRPHPPRPRLGLPSRASRQGQQRRSRSPHGVRPSRRHPRPPWP